MKKIALYILLSIVGSIGLASVAKADGGVFVQPDYYTFEKEQQAFIYFHDNTEDLVIMTSYQGNAKDFTWVVPTPAKPEVNKSSASLFTNLMQITDTYKGNDVVAPMFSGKGIDTATESIEIIEHKNIDIFETTVLKADSETALSKWMKDNGYTFPEENNYILSNYIDNNWYFVISKIRPELSESERVASDLSSGDISPLRFTFSTNRIIYPMKLTNMANEYQKTIYKDDNAMDWYSPITANIYVLSDKKVVANGFTVNYANWLKPDKASSLIETATEANWLNPTTDMFLTKLYSYNVSESNNDLVIRSDKNNDIYPVPYYKAPGYVVDIIIAFFITLILFLLSPIFLLNIVFLYVSKLKNNPFIFNLSQFVATLLTTVLLIIYVLLISNGSLYISGGTFDIQNIVEKGALFGVFISLSVITILMILYSVKLIINKKRR